MDQNWTKHIDTMASLREGIHLRSYANTNPLQDYVNEGYDMFREMLDTVSVDVCFKLLNVIVQKKAPEEQQAEQEAKKNDAIDAEINEKE